MNAAIRRLPRIDQRTASTTRLARLRGDGHASHGLGYLLLSVYLGLAEIISGFTVTPRF